MKKYLLMFGLFAIIISGLNCYIAENAALVNAGDVVNAKPKSSNAVEYTATQFGELKTGTASGGDRIRFGSEGWTQLLNQLRGKTLSYDVMMNIAPSVVDRYIWCRFKVLYGKCNLILLNEKNQVVTVIYSADQPQKILLPKSFRGKLIERYTLLMVTNDFTAVCCFVQLVEPE